MYSVEKAGSIKILKKFEYPLFVAVLILSALGLMILKSATASHSNSSSMMKTQIVSLFIGVILALVLSSIDYKDLKSIAWITYIFSVILLLLVFFIGVEIAGNKNWISIKGIRFQPSELAKVTFVLYMSAFLEKLKEAGSSSGSDKIKALIFFFIPVGIILLEKDKGAVISFCFIFFCMLFMYGLKYKYLIALAGTSIVFSPLAWFLVLSENNKQRIYTFFDPYRDPLGAGMNVIRSIRAIGSGGILGQGWGKGIQSQNGGVPVSESDFIFSVIGEELGFVGACIIIGLILFILIRGLYIARNSREFYGSYVAGGMSAIIAFNFIENVGMTIGVLPVTGVPLPFVSQGGTAILMNFIAIGFILSVSVRRKRDIFNSNS